MGADIWDEARADAALAAVHARCYQALTNGQANTEARWKAIETSREVAVQHHREHDPLLYDDLESLEAMIQRWYQ